MNIHVRKGKGDKDRYTLLSQRLLVELRAYWSLVRPSGPCLFVGQRGRPLCRETVGDALREAGQECGITKPVHPHALRHAFATHLYEMGTDLQVIQKLLGHESIETTQIYARVTTKKLAGTRSPLDLLGTPEGQVLS